MTELIDDDQMKNICHHFLHIYSYITGFRLLQTPTLAGPTCITQGMLQLSSSTVDQEVDLSSLLWGRFHPKSDSSDQGFYDHKAAKKGRKHHTLILFPTL